MLLWRNNQIEDVDGKELHNLITSTIDNAAKEFGLLFEVIECEPPTIQRSLWTEDNIEKTHLLVKGIQPINKGESYIIEFQTLIPPDKFSKAFALLDTPRSLGKLREHLLKISNWYRFGKEFFPPPPKRGASDG